MTIYSRPDEKVFASGAKPGEVVPFPDTERGWGLSFEQTEGKPPMEWMNDAMRRVDEAVRYLMQRGISEWSATEDYPAGAYVQHAGKTYRSLLASTNIAPGTAVATWLVWGVDRNDAPRLRTFAEVNALVADEGPIVVHDMDGTAWTWVSTAHFTGYRSKMCGEIMGGNTTSPRPFQILATGGTWLESNPKAKRVIAHFREQGLVVPIGDWKKGQGMIADLGSGSWKAPDFQDMFLRMSGTDADTANARLLATHQRDELRSHRHAAYAIVSPGSANAYQSGGSTSASNTEMIAYFGGAETRPASTAVVPYIHC